jgi:Protein of unknown function (DUF2934)
VKRNRSEASEKQGLTKPEQQDLTKLEQDDVVRCRAYELYEQRGRADGHELDDWVEAEREVLSASEIAKAA